MQYWLYKKGILLRNLAWTGSGDIIQTKKLVTGHMLYEVPRAIRQERHGVGIVRVWTKRKSN